MKAIAKKKAKTAVLHWLSHLPHKRAACGSPSGYTTWDKNEVTCKKCQKSMDKYDIESI